MRLPGVDPIAEAIFRENLKTIASTRDGRKIPCVFVPQVVTDAYPVNGGCCTWEPASLSSALAWYNEDVKAAEAAAASRSRNLFRMPLGTD